MAPNITALITVPAVLASAVMSKTSQIVACAPSAASSAALSTRPSACCIFSATVKARAFELITRVRCALAMPTPT